MSLRDLPARIRGRQVPALLRSKGTLAQLYSGRDNAIGFLRLMLASAVVLHHSKPLGFGEHDLGFDLFRGQTAVGTLAVYGFFVLSGLLITSSAQRAPIVRYIWHRCLRILPALWVCLIVTAFVVAPLVALREHGTLRGFFAGPQGPFQYVMNNWFTGVRQWGIHDLLQETTPWGRISGASVFDGALWSLVYESLCYVIVGLLAITGVLNHARRFVLLLAAGTYTLIALDHMRPSTWATGPRGDYGGTVLPLLGGVSFMWLVYLGFFFAFGACVHLYREKVPINDALGVASGVVFVGSLLVGGFFLVGAPAFAYLLIWLSVRLPRVVHPVGRRADYSYGVYIYGFVGQQVFASLGWQRWGFVAFSAISLAAAYGAAFLSWHLVEKRALALKGWTPRLRARTTAVPAPEPATEATTDGLTPSPAESRARA
ncbi:MAG: acyltransferase [Micromonosporaceae bacterium]|nr:acyltransferase [Micromonosporaceae bacterium]